MSFAISIIILIIASQVFFVSCLPNSILFETFFGYLFGIAFSVCCFCGGGWLYWIAGALSLLAVIISFCKEYKKGTFYR